MLRLHSWGFLVEHGKTEEPSAHLESIRIIDRFSKFVRIVFRGPELFFGSISSIKIVKVVGGLSRILARFRIAVKISELYWARLQNTTTSEIVKGKRAMVGDVV